MKTLEELLEDYRQAALNLDYDSGSTKRQKFKDAQVAIVSHVGAAMVAAKSFGEAEWGHLYPETMQSHWEFLVKGWTK